MAMAWLQFKHSTGFEAGIKKSLSGRTGSKSTYQVLIQVPGASRWLVTGYTSRKHIYIHQPDCPAAQGDPPLLNLVGFIAKRQFPCQSKRRR